MQLTLKGLEELSTSDNLSQTTLALFLFLIPNWGKIYPDLVAPEQLLGDAGVKWLSDTDSPPFVHPSQQTPKLKGRRERTANGLTPSVRQDPLAPAERVCGMPLTPRGMRAATRFQCGADSPRGPLLRGQPRQPPPAPKRARTRRPQARASRTPAPRARPQTPPPPQRGRSDLPARVPVRPVIHVCNTHPTREREGGGQQSPTRRGPGELHAGAARRADRAGDAARQMSARGSGYRRRGGHAAGGRSLGGGGRPGPGEEGAAGPKAQRGARPRPPTPARGLSRYSPAGKLRAPPGLSRPPASGARKRPHIAGGRAGGLRGARFPTSVLPRLRLPLLPRRKLARSLGRGGRAGGRADNGCSAASGGRWGRMRRGGGGGGGHAEPAGLRPGPGTRRLRGDGGGSVSG